MPMCSTDYLVIYARPGSAREPRSSGVLHDGSSYIIALLLRVLQLQAAPAARCCGQFAPVGNVTGDSLTAHRMLAVQARRLRGLRTLLSKGIITATQSNSFTASGR
jgi:hypothetical protein